VVDSLEQRCFRGKFVGFYAPMGPLPSLGKIFGGLRLRLEWCSLFGQLQEARFPLLTISIEEA
jgi:hypothetical protein